MRRRVRSRRTESPRARNRCSTSWDASPCSATTRSFSKRRASGKWKAIRPRGRSIRSQASSAWIGRPSRMGFLASMPSRSSRNTSSWRRSTSPPTARSFSSSRGAPEVILDHCDRQQTAGSEARPIDRAYFMSASDKLAGQGERVLALAWLERPAVQSCSLSATDLPKNLVLLGLIGLLDPPRKEAVEAVHECHGGGIRVTMITGDHKITAAAIAKMLGIGDGKTAITGAEIEEMNEAALQEKVRNVDVFARASPEHKLRLANAIQPNRQILAITGDGVNDAPALQKADHGLAMGLQGNAVT